MSSIAIAVILFFSTPVLATNGYQLIGVGSYQKSLAGAVTALPGSNMTAVSNPAGMIRIGNRADFSMEAFMPERNTDFSAFGGSIAESNSEIYGIPAIGWNGPVGNRDDLVFGGGMYGTSGMGVDYSSTLMMPATYWDGYSSIAFWQMAPALAWQASEKLSIGASVNIDFQQVAFKQRIMADTDADQQGDLILMNFDLGRSASAFGFGITLGVLYDITDMVTLGASYKSKQFFTDLEYQLANGDIDMTFFGGAPLAAGTYKLDLDFPQQFAFGIAVHATQSLTIAADVKWIEWSDTMNKLSVIGPGSTTAMDPGWDDQVIYAIGVAYKATDNVNLRAGFNYSESPIDETSASSNLILPAIVETHYTLGADYKFNEHWDIGFHYMYVPEVTIISGPTATFPPGIKISLSEQSFGMNLGYRF